MAFTSLGSTMLKLTQASTWLAECNFTLFPLDSSIHVFSLRSNLDFILANSPARNYESAQLPLRALGPQRQLLFEGERQPGPSRVTLSATIEPIVLDQQVISFHLDRPFNCSNSKAPGCDDCTSATASCRSLGGQLLPSSRLMHFARCS